MTYHRMRFLVALGGRFPLVGLLTLMISAPVVQAYANPYDDCVLEHLPSAQSEAATFAIERACISKTSIPLNITDVPADLYAKEARTIDDMKARASGLAYLHGMAWVAHFLSPDRLNLIYGLLVEIKNSTSFAITELVVTVEDRKTEKTTNEYVISDFDTSLDGPGYISKLADPAQRNIIPVGAARKFFVQASEVTEATADDFSKKFYWHVRLSKGIPIATGQGAAPDDAIMSDEQAARFLEERDARRFGAAPSGAQTTEPKGFTKQEIDELANERYGPKR
jgi:hypothetical protein